MLIRFQVENFLSFNKIQNFSMIAGNLKNKEDHVLKKAGVKLLKLSAIYGANASGKTNLIKGINLFKFIVVNTVPSDISNLYFRENIENKDKLTTFEVELIKNNSVYAYGIKINLNKRVIDSEWLYKLSPDKNKEEIVYERELENKEYKVKYNKKIVKGEDEKRLNFIISDISMNYTTLLMNEMNRNKSIEKNSELFIFQEVYDWFESDLKIYFPNDAITQFDYVIGKDELKNKALNNIVASFDTGINCVTLEKINKDEISKVYPPGLVDKVLSDMRKQSNDSNVPKTGTSVIRSSQDFLQISNVTNQDYDLETVKLRHSLDGTTYDFREESDGTRRLFDLLDILLNSENNKVFIVDELDRSLHPNLTYKFLELFFEIALDKNIQLILTTHESKIMDLNLVRQDEIWFVERNNMNDSKLYSLDSFKERYDKKIEKAYLEGRYGAIPVFSSFESYAINESGS